MLVLVAVAGLIRGPGDISKYVMAPAVASATGQPRERVLGLADGVSRASSIIGPIGAAALVVVIGAPAALAVDAASFAVCALIVATLVPRTIGQPLPDADEDGLTYLQRLRSGARFLRQDGLLRSIVGMVATTNLLDAALATVLLAVWARSRGGGAGLMGAVSATMAAGAVIGAVAAAIYGHRLPRRATFGWGFFLIGGPRFLVLASGAPLWVVLGVIFVGGIGAGTINPILAAVELERIPEHLRGRVMALINSAAWALIPFGGLVGGLLSERLGISAALAICGVLYAIATTLPALRPEWRAMDRRPVPGSPSRSDGRQSVVPFPRPAELGRPSCGVSPRTHAELSPDIRCAGYSHSMVPGGLLVTSRTTRLTSGTSLVIRVEIRASTS